MARPASPSQEGATEVEGGHGHTPPLGSSFGGGEKLLEGSLLMVVPCRMVQVGTWGQRAKIVAPGHLPRQHQTGSGPRPLSPTLAALSLPILASLLPAVSLPPPTSPALPSVSCPSYPLTTPHCRVNHSGLTCCPTGPFLLLGEEELCHQWAPTSPRKLREVPLSTPSPPLGPQSAIAGAGGVNMDPETGGRLLPPPATCSPRLSSCGC